jgi:hypothetical protein
MDVGASALAVFSVAVGPPACVRARTCHGKSDVRVTEVIFWRREFKFDQNKQSLLKIINLKISFL